MGIALESSVVIPPTVSFFEFSKGEVNESLGRGRKSFSYLNEIGGAQIEPRLV